MRRAQCNYEKGGCNCLEKGLDVSIRKEPKYYLKKDRCNYAERRWIYLFREDSGCGCNGLGMYLLKRRM